MGCLLTWSENFKDFDPNLASKPDQGEDQVAGIFGLPIIKLDQSQIAILPVPWEVTTSYGKGTARGPEAIIRASHQVDLYDLDVLNPYLPGIYCQAISHEVLEKNQVGLKQRVKLRKIHHLDTKYQEILLDQLNSACLWLNEWVYTESMKILGQKKILGILGGDHSVPLGAIRAIGEQVADFGILHFDAHSDTRKAFEGFTFSHASIMSNVLGNVQSVSKLVQVGIRDICEEESQFICSQKNKIHLFSDQWISRRKFGGDSWRSICNEMILSLPNNVWVSFDIDGLDPSLCPNTGTPVPGGLSFQEANYLISTLVSSGRKIIGFDLCEVSPGEHEMKGEEWDANVGARFLYKLIGWTLASHGLAKIHE